MKRPREDTKITKLVDINANTNTAVDAVATEVEKFRRFGSLIFEKNQTLSSLTNSSTDIEENIEQSTSSISAEIEASSWGLLPSLCDRVSKSGIKEFFPVQRDVLPILLAASRGSCPVLGDVCVSAPTGSGKTLVYILPILDALLRGEAHVVNSGTGRSRVLKAVVVLPTRDLAQQVFNVFQGLIAPEGGEPLSISVALSVGQTSFAKEQASVSSVCALSSRPVLGASTRASGAVSDSGCDILVCTPGRLVDHLDATPGFDLSNLQFLAIDEADRLLSDHYQDWVRRVNEAVFQAKWTDERQTYCRSYSTAISNSNSVVLEVEQPTSTIRLDRIQSIHPMTIRASDADKTRVAKIATPDVSIDTRIVDSRTKVVLSLPRWIDNSSQTSSSSGSNLVTSQKHTPLYVPFRRIVCSATLTSNPQKLAALGLRQPRYFVSTKNVSSIAQDSDEDNRAEDIDDKKVYTLPSTLHQAYSVVGAADKPTALIFLLRLLEGHKLESAAILDSPAPIEFQRSGMLAIVFTGSTETTHRLCRLLQLFGGLSGRIVEFSSSMSQAKRTAVMEGARAGVVSVMVSSDAAARGLDLPSLPAVIHYDVAVRPKVYVHRVGRTARAGKVGLTFSLVKPDQARHFKQLLAKTRGGAERGVLKESLQPHIVEAFSPRMETVLARLQTLLEEERNGASETRPVKSI
jgi:ATP-dependent RNA helicase DDX51/DBP6